MRLLAGAAAGSAFRTTLVGDESLMRRPMDRLAGPLGALGANIETSAGGVPPVVTGGGRLRGADVVIASRKGDACEKLAAEVQAATGRQALDIGH